MAADSKKQGGKNKASKKTTSKNTGKISDKVSTSTGAAKKSKKPASFSKNATAKAAPKKSPKKTETKKTDGVKTTKTTEAAPNFAEFETLKLGDATKFDSKIILRDVERETVIESPKKVNKEVGEPEKLSTDIVIPRKRIIKSAPKLTAKEIKEREIEKAIKTATKLPEADKKTRRKKGIFGEFGLARVVLAAACITTAIFAVVYFINSTSADMSLRVAAAQSGIETRYPSYTPRGYSLSNVTSSSGKVSMHFSNGEGDYTVTEESSNWDSEALLNNYIKSTYGNEYAVIREQGLTLYMGGSWEAWVNGGVLYKLTINSGSLSKKQMKSIAVSF